MVISRYVSSIDRVYRMVQALDKHRINVIAIVPDGSAFWVFGQAETIDFDAVDESSDQYEMGSL